MTATVTQSGRLSILARRVLGDGVFGAWAYSLSGFLAARVLGFLFSVVASRVLEPDAFGELVYGLAVAAIASVFLSSAPIGISRDLAIARDDRATLTRQYSNWIVATTVLLAASILAAPAIGAVAALSGAMVAGLIANLVGVAALETYREAQRGMNRYPEMAASYVLANVLQLGAAVLCGIAGWRSAPLFYAIYGLSPLLMLGVMERVRPLGLTLLRASVSLPALRSIARFVVPLGVQSISFAIWMGADVLFLKNDAGPAAAGVYGVAKSIAMIIVVPSLTLASIVAPLVARTGAADVRVYVIRLSVLGLATSVVAALCLVLPAAPIVRVLFGNRYEAAVDVLPVVAVGMVCWGAYHVIARLWVGLGRPTVDMYCTIAGMLVTLAAGAILVPRLGLDGAGWTFALGSAARLLLVVCYAARAALPPPSRADE